MIKLTFSLSPPQVAWVRDEAARLGISPAELIRRLIDAARKA